MTISIFSNNATTTVAAPITAQSTSLQVTAGSGSLFPILNTGYKFIGTFNKAGAATTLEIVWVTATSTDTFTIVRAQEGTTALSWNAGDYFSLFPTAGALNSFIQTQQLQEQSGNFAIDTGSANAYSVNLTPPLTAHVLGMPIRWLAGHTNTGDSTFNDGAGAANLAVQPGVFVPAGAIVAGGIYTSIWDGTRFQTSYAPNLVQDLAPYATIAELDARTGIVKTGAFNCANGTVPVNFASPFPSVCNSVIVQWAYANPDVGWVNGAPSPSGFSYTNSNAGLCFYIAVGN